MMLLVDCCQTGQTVSLPVDMHQELTISVFHSIALSRDLVYYRERSENAFGEGICCMVS
jgi:hypothetical protein